MRTMKTKVAAIAMAGLLAVPAMADLNTGDKFFNPDVAPAVNKFVSGLPAWFTAFDATSAFDMHSTIQGDYAGMVDSAVFYLNGSNANDGLGFAYQVHLDSIPGGPGLQELDFAGTNNRWGNTRISAVGADGSGSSTTTGGTYTWADGDPLHISRENGDGHLGLDFYAQEGFSSVDNGTYIPGGGAFSTSIFWYEAPDTHSWSTDQLNMQNHGQGYAMVVMVPVPGAMLLGAMGLGMIGWVKRRKGASSSQ